MSEARESVEALIEQSSLGTRGAKRLRARTPPAITEAILAIAARDRGHSATAAGTESPRDEQAAALPEESLTGAESAHQPQVLSHDRPDATSEEPKGFRAVQACKIVGITHGQLNYWIHTGLATPSIQPPRGSGTQRLYSFEDLVELKLIKNLLDAGVSIQRVREATTYLRELGHDLSGVTLVSDGKSIYACTSPDQVIDLLRRGQGVFGIDIDPLLEELRGSVSQLPIGRGMVEPPGRATSDIEYALDDDEWRAAAGPSMGLMLGEVAGAAASVAFGAIVPVAAMGPRTLTRREREVAALAVAGKSTRDIASELSIGERTVETHLANAYAKLGFESKGALRRRIAQPGI